MARIPMGGFGEGQTTAPVQTTRLANPVGAVGQAVDRLANIAGDIATHASNQLAQRDDDLERAEAANALLDHEIATKTIGNEVESLVATGELDYREARKAYDERLAELPPPETGKFKPAIALGLQTGFKRNQFNGSMAVEGAVERARAADFKGQSVAAIDKLTKLAGLPGADITAINTQIAALGPLVSRAGLDTKILQDAQDANWTTEVQQRVIAGQGDLAALEAIETDLTSDKGRYFDKLDAEKRTMAWRSVQSDIAQLKNHQQAEVDKRETIAANVVTKAQDDVVTGIPLSASRWQADAEAVKGTTHEAKFNQVLQQADEVLRLQSMPFADQTAYINNVEARLKAGSDDPSRDQTLVNTLRRVLDEGQKLAKESPITFAQYRTGNPFPQIDFSALASGDPAAVTEQLQQRFIAIGTMRKLFGPEVGMNPWRPEEASALKQVMAQADDKGKLVLLSTIAASAPDVKAYAGALTPLASSERVTMLAGIAQFRKLRSSGGIEVAPTMLAGSRILADKSIPRPTEDKMRIDFEERMGDALPDGSPQRADAYLAFKTLYMGLAGPKGVRHEDNKAEPDDDVARLAFSLASGGVSEMQGGHKVIRPWGMDEDRFSSRVDTEIERIATSTGFDAGDLRDLPLYAVPGVEGSYYLMDGPTPIIDPKTRRPTVVKVK